MTPQQRRAERVNLLSLTALPANEPALSNALALRHAECAGGFHLSLGNGKQAGAVILGFVLPVSRRKQLPRAVRNGFGWGSCGVGSGNVSPVFTGLRALIAWLPLLGIS